MCLISHRRNLDDIVDLEVSDNECTPGAGGKRMQKDVKL